MSSKEQTGESALPREQQHIMDRPLFTRCKPAVLRGFGAVDVLSSFKHPAPGGVMRSEE
jgi:hypothetical protein